MEMKQVKSRSPELLADFLQRAGIRATRQRLALAALLFTGGHKHLTAEQLYTQLRKQRAKVSLATVYNCLHQFTEAGLLRQIAVDQSSAYFDTNTGGHHHFYDPDTNVLIDIPLDAVAFKALPKAPQGRKIQQVDLVFHLASKD